MKRLGVVILLLWLCASIAVGMQDAVELIKYTSTEGRYTVLLPAQPKLITTEATAGTGEKFPQYIALVVEPGDIAYLVGYFDHLPGTVFSFDFARDRIVANLKATVTKEASISMDGFPGREYTLTGTASDGSAYLARVRFYDYKKRIYVVQFILPKSLDGPLNDAKAAKYFDSFKVTGN